MKIIELLLTQMLDGYHYRGFIIVVYKGKKTHNLELTLFNEAKVRYTEANTISEYDITVYEWLTDLVNEFSSV